MRKWRRPAKPALPQVEDAEGLRILTVLLAFLAVGVGTALLCLSMRRHYRLWLSLPLSKLRAYAMRVAAYGSLAAGAWLSIAAYGTGEGLTVFVALFTVTTLATALAVTGLTRTGD